MAGLVAVLIALAPAPPACSGTADQATDPAGAVLAVTGSAVRLIQPGGIGGSLIDEEYDASYLIDVVRNGIGTMPAFGRSLSEEEVNALVDYVSVGLKPAPG